MRPTNRIGRLAVESERVLISLCSITDRFPEELQSLIAIPPSPTVTIAISVDSIMERLYTGRAQATIAELRKMSPVGVFVEDTSRDSEHVDLPLQDVLRRLDPSLFKRTLQMRMEVSSEIPSVFEKKGSAPAAEEERFPQDEQESAPLSRVIEEVEAPADEIELPIPVQEPVLAPAKIPFILQESKVIPEPKEELPKPVAPVVVPPLSLLKEEIPVPAPEPVVIPAPAPAPQPAFVPPGSLEDSYVTESIAVPVEKLFAKWPQGIRAELAKLPADATVNIPLDELSHALKHGRVRFTWLQIQCWMTPPLAGESAVLGEIALELPLPVVAPLFLAVGGGSTFRPNRPRVTLDEAAPSPFVRNAPPALRSEEPPHGAASTNPVEAESVVELPENERLPAELVARACSFGGVAGAVVTLPEGLLVAAKLPPELNREAVAAFLPQVYTRLEQTIVAMELGALQTVTFTANDRAWQIWKTGDVYFAAVGVPRAQLPGAQLQLLANRLAQQSKL